MFIVWGTKIKRRRLGSVAECCPVCNEIRRCELFRLGAASHVYYISFGQGHLVGHELECAGCKTRLPTNVNCFKSVEDERDVSLEHLIAATHPEVVDFLGERREAFELARSRQDAEQRDVFLREPFLLLDTLIERQLSERKLGNAGRWTAWSTVALLMALVMVGVNGGPAWLGVGVASLFGLAFFATLCFMATHLGSFVRREIYPRLALSLAPLEPDVAELDRLLQQLKGLGLRIGKKVKSERLYGAIAERGLTELPNPG